MTSYHERLAAAQAERDRQARQAEIDQAVQDALDGRNRKFEGEMVAWANGKLQRMLAEAATFLAQTAPKLDTLHLTDTPKDSRRVLSTHRGWMLSCDGDLVFSDLFLAYEQPLQLPRLGCSGMYFSEYEMTQGSSSVVSVNCYFDDVKEGANDQPALTECIRTSGNGVYADYWGWDAPVVDRLGRIFEYNRHDGHIDLEEPNIKVSTFEDRFQRNVTQRALREN